MRFTASTETSKSYGQESPESSVSPEPAKLPEATLESLLSVDDSTEEWIAIPEWNMRVKIRGLSKTDQLKARKQASRSGQLDPQKLESLVLAYGMVTPKITPDKIDQLFQKSSGIIDRILTGILRLSGMDEATDKGAEADFQE